MALSLTGQLKGTAAGIALATVLGLSNSAIAGEVRLKSPDGTVNLVGEFVDFKDGNFFILTPLGELRISENRVQCEGASCPSNDAAVAEVEAPETDDAATEVATLQIDTPAKAAPAEAEAKEPMEVVTIEVDPPAVLTTPEKEAPVVEEAPVDVATAEPEAPVVEAIEEAPVVAAAPEVPEAEAPVEVATLEVEAPQEAAVVAPSSNLAIAGSRDSGLSVMSLLMTGLTASFDTENASGDSFRSYFVSADNDDDAFKALLDRSAQVVMSSRRISEVEAQTLQAAGAGNMASPAQEHFVALENMVVVTHPENSVGQLTQDQLRAIYSGRITNWKDVGGSDAEINVIGRAKDTESYEYFMSSLYGANMPDFAAPAVAQDDLEVANAVQRDENAIGYVGYAFQLGAQPVTLVNSCGIASKPDAFSAKTGEYDMSRLIYLYNRADNLDPSSQEFVDFAVSDKADHVIEKLGYIDLGILRRNQGLSDERRVALTAEAANSGAGIEGAVMREMLDAMSSNDRLSTTLRFRTGSSRLDERAKYDLQRLIEHLENEPEGTKVTFVGFTDDVGTFENNRGLSNRRAGSALQEMQRAAQGRLDHIEMSTSGFGETAPLACNTVDTGKALNRRVEVWISNDPAT